MYTLLYTSSLDTYYIPSFMPSFVGVLSGTSVGVGNVSDDIVGVFQHPIVAPGNGVMWVDGLDPLRKHSVGVVVVFCLLTGHIGQHNSVVDLWIFLL